MHFTCPRTLKPFIAEPLTDDQVNDQHWYQVACQWCDVDMHTRGDEGYNRYQPQIHVLKPDQEKEYGG